MEKGTSIKQIVVLAILKKQTLKIDYVNNKNEVSTRTISNIALSNDYGSEYIKAFCHLKNEERTFKICNILKAKVVEAVDPLKYEFDASKPIFNLYGEKY